MSKFWRRPTTRVILVLMLLGPVGAECILIAVDKNSAVYPAVASVLFAGSTLMFVALATVVVAVLALGNDYELGTVRTFLSRGVGRSQFILSKIITTVSAALANGLAYMSCGLSVTCIAHTTYSDVPLLEAAGADLVWRAVGAVAVVGVVGFVSSGVVMLALVLGRSSWMGMLGGLGYFLTDFYVGGLWLAETDWYRYTVSYHALTVLERFFPSDPHLATTWQSGIEASSAWAVLVLLAYGCALTLASILIFQRQDLTTKA
jgi:ABC-type transport system involved in multi-copper enzyme maturation permease subunit